MKKILITGAGGFAGHNMAECFDMLGKDAYVVTPHFYTNKNGQSDVHCGDLSDLEYCHNLLMAVQPDVIVHCAGRVPKKGATISDDVFDRDNVQTIKNIVQVSEKLSQNPHIILPSTAAVYPVENIEKTKNCEITVEDFLQNKGVVHKFREDEVKPIEQMDPYCQSKARGEDELHDYSGPWTILRKPTLVGIDDMRGNFAYEAIFHALNETSFIENAKFQAQSLGHVREYLTVEDMYHAVDLSIQNPASRGEIFNIGNGEPKAGFEVIGHVADLMGGFNHESYVITAPEAKDLCIKTSVVLDSSKAKNVIGFQPQDTGINTFRKLAQGYAGADKKDDHINKVRSVLAI